MVCDASAVVELLLRTSRGREVEEVLAAPGADVHVPAFCDVEVASALRRLRLSDQLDTRRCAEAVADYRDLPLTRHGHTTLLDRVLDLGTNMTAYDAIYVVLAERLGARFLTTDRRLRTATTNHTSVRLAP